MSPLLGAKIGSGCFICWEEISVFVPSDLEKIVFVA